MLFTLVAAVVSANGDSIQIDKGVTDGLRPGDSGGVFYELTVGDESKRVELGPVAVLSVELSSAEVGLPEGKSVRPGFLIEFEIDKERLAPGSTVAAVRQHLGEEAADELAQRYLEQLRPAPTISDLASSAVGEPGVAPSSHAAMLRVAAGDYAIGLDSGEARYYNEMPRFEKPLASFWIDPAPTYPAPSDSDGLDFAQVEAQCLARGKRLPTEFEWEAATRHPGFRIPEHLEWTSSWYVAYPGNRRSEREYGQRFRVLRGSNNTEVFRPQERHYLAPEKSSPDLGFRCAASTAD